MKLKIIFSTDTLARGGKERIMAILSSNLIKKEYELIFLTKRIDDGMNYLKEYFIDSNLISIYRRFWAYKRLIKTHKPDIVVSWDGISSFYNLLLCNSCNFIFINGSIRHGIRLFRISHLFRSLVCRLSPYILANSEAGMRANNLKPDKRKFVMYNGVETKFRNNLTQSEIESLKKKLIPDYMENPGFIFISVANFVPYKDYFTVLKALAKIKKDFMFYYFILGDGPMRDEIKKSIRAYELDNRVIFAGRNENVRDYLFASDVMIHSSRGEGISNAILEGMYAGLPVIATSIGGIPETVFPESSKLFPYRDHEALYQCLLKSRELKTSFNPQSDAYQAHLKKFSVETMINKFEEIIESVTKIEMKRSTAKLQRH
jgi:glycosyltransferase involved in cell wall biosynthesis